MLFSPRRDFWASAECQAAGAQYDAADVVCEGVFVLRSVGCEVSGVTLRSGVRIGVLWKRLNAKGKNKGSTSLR